MWNEAIDVEHEVHEDNEVESEKSLKLETAHKLTPFVNAQKPTCWRAMSKHFAESG